MAFDIEKMEISRTKEFNGVTYRVIEESSCGLLIVAKEDDVKSGKYPLPLVVIPED